MNIWTQEARARRRLTRLGGVLLSLLTVSSAGAWGTSTWGEFEPGPVDLRGAPPQEAAAGATEVPVFQSEVPLLGQSWSPSPAMEFSLPQPWFGAAAQAPDGLWISDRPVGEPQQLAFGDDAIERFQTWGQPIQKHAEDVRTSGRELFSTWDRVQAWAEATGQRLNATWSRVEEPFRPRDFSARGDFATMTDLELDARYANRKGSTPEESDRIRAAAQLVLYAQEKLEQSTQGELEYKRSLVDVLGATSDYYRQVGNLPAQQASQAQRKAIVDEVLNHYGILAP